MAEPPETEPGPRTPSPPPGGSQPPPSPPAGAEPPPSPPGGAEPPPSPAGGAEASPPEGAEPPPLPPPGGSETPLPPPGGSETPPWPPGGAGEAPWPAGGPGGPAFGALRAALEAALARSPGEAAPPALAPALAAPLPPPAKCRHLDGARLLRDNLRPRPGGPPGGAGGLRTALSILEKYGRNLLQPRPPRYWRAVKYNNPVFRGTVGAVRGGRAVLRLYGYTEETGDGLSFAPGVAAPHGPRVAAVTADVLLLRAELDLLLANKHPNPQFFTAILEGCPEEPPAPESPPAPEGAAPGAPPGAGGGCGLCGPPGEGPRAPCPACRVLPPPSSPPAPPRRPPWVCGACGGANGALAVLCGACERPRGCPGPPAAAADPPALPGEGGPPRGGGGPWACASCTFLNAAATVLCGVCERPRLAGRPPAPPRGWQCPHCTYRNEGPGRVCELCHRTAAAPPAPPADEEGPRRPGRPPAPPARSQEAERRRQERLREDGRRVVALVRAAEAAGLPPEAVVPLAVATTAPWGGTRRLEEPWGGPTAWAAAAVAGARAALPGALGALAEAAGRRAAADPRGPLGPISLREAARAWARARACPPRALEACLGARRRQGVPGGRSRRCVLVQSGALVRTGAGAGGAGRRGAGGGGGGAGPQRGGRVGGAGRPAAPAPGALPAAPLGPPRAPPRLRRARPPGGSAAGAGGAGAAQLGPGGAAGGAGPGAGAAGGPGAGAGRPGGGRARLPRPGLRAAPAELGVRRLRLGPAPAPDAVADSVRVHHLPRVLPAALHHRREGEAGGRPGVPGLRGPRPRRRRPAPHPLLHPRHPAAGLPGRRDLRALLPEADGAGAAARPQVPLVHPLLVRVHLRGGAGPGPVSPVPPALLPPLPAPLGAGARRPLVRRLRRLEAPQRPPSAAPRPGGLPARARHRVPAVRGVVRAGPGGLHALPVLPVPPPLLQRLLPALLRQGQLPRGGLPAAGVPARPPPPRLPLLPARLGPPPAPAPPPGERRRLRHGAAARRQPRPRRGLRGAGAEGDGSGAAGRALREGGAAGTRRPLPGALQGVPGARHQRAPPRPGAALLAAGAARRRRAPPAGAAPAPPRRARRRLPPPPAPVPGRGGAAGSCRPAAAPPAVTTWPPLPRGGGGGLCVPPPCFRSSPLALSPPPFGISPISGPPFWGLHFGISILGCFPPPRRHFGEPGCFPASLRGFSPPPPPAPSLPVWFLLNKSRSGLRLPQRLYGLVLRGGGVA